VATVWAGGKRVARAVVASPGASAPPLDQALAQNPGAVVAYETVVGEGPILTRPEAAFALSLVPGRDGVKATLGGATAYVTPDEILARQGYDKGVAIESIGLQFGADVPWILARLSKELHAPVPDILASATIHRIRVERSVPARPPPARIGPADLTPDLVRTALLDAAAYLARGVNDEGYFRYMVDAPTNTALAGYDWPRHAGATYFLAQAAALSGDDTLKAACLRAAHLIEEHAYQKCMMTRCIGTDEVVDVGSAALTIMAFVEISRAGLDVHYAQLVPELAHFLRAQQRADGEFMHLFDRGKNKPLDVQLPYFSGEASLALARAFLISHEGADLTAASRGLAHLVGPAWRFFGDRYYWGEEHWTCQALDDLWAHAPDRAALDFCLRWHGFNRAMQYGPGDTAFDADGAFGVGPVVTPRLTPVASRTEAAVATLEAARRAHAPPEQIAALEQQIRRSIALLLRNQLRPGASHLFADPGAVYGAMPGSAVDWQLRIDYAQHAGSAMVRWLALTETTEAADRP
jgi:hypothetical protein